MKKIFLAMFCLMAIQSVSQVKISQMTPLVGKCDTCWVPIVSGSTNYKARANQFYDLFNIVNPPGIKVDSITIDAKGLTGGQQTSMSIGIDAMKGAVGTYSTAIGYKSQETSSNQSHNTSVGAFSLNKVNQWGNSAFGSNSLFSNTGGYRNSGFGAFSLHFEVNGRDNSCFGFSSLYNVTSGQFNTAIGSNSGASIINGNFNVSIGQGAHGYGAILSGETAKMTGSDNIAIGTTAGIHNTSGNYNIGIGRQALEVNSTGTQNISIGYGSGRLITTGNYNVILGGNTGSSIATANNQVLISDGQGNERIHFDESNNIILQPGGKLIIPTSGNASVGTATLSSGTVVVNTTKVTSSSIIIVSFNTPSGTQGFLSTPIGSIVNATSFVINSSSGSDNSTVNWWIIN